MFHKQYSMVFKSAQKTETMSEMGHTLTVALSLVHRVLIFWFLRDLL